MPRSEAVLPLCLAHRASALESLLLLFLLCVTWVEPATSGLAPNESNPDGEMSHFAVVWALKRNYPQSYIHLFPHVSEGEKVFWGHIASCDGPENCNTTVWPLSQFGFNSWHTSWGLILYSGRKRRQGVHLYIQFMLPTWMKEWNLSHQATLPLNSEVLPLIPTAVHAAKKCTNVLGHCSHYEARRTTSSAKSLGLPQQNWIISNSCLMLETLPMKVTKRIGDEAQPWQSPTPTESGHDLYANDAVTANIPLL